MSDNTLAQKVSEAIRVLQYEGALIADQNPQAYDRDDRLGPYKRVLHQWMRFESGVPGALLQAWFVGTDAGDGRKIGAPGRNILGACEYLVASGAAECNPLTQAPPPCKIERPDGALIELCFPRPAGDSPLEAYISLTGAAGNTQFHHVWTGLPTTGYACRHAPVKSSPPKIDIVHPSRSMPLTKAAKLSKGKWTARALPGLIGAGVVTGKKLGPKSWVFDLDRHPELADD